MVLPRLEASLAEPTNLAFGFDLVEAIIKASDIASELFELATFQKDDEPDVDVIAAEFSAFWEELRKELDHEMPHGLALLLEAARRCDTPVSPMQEHLEAALRAWRERT
jgi:hypothetical protein